MKKKIASAMTLLTAAPALMTSACAEAPVQLAGELAQGQAIEYTPVANVKGEFCFDQQTVVPADDMFNLFGTVATGLCAKPGFAFDKVDHQDYYVNFGGKIKKNATYTLEQLKEMETQNTMTCSCATGNAVANIDVAGVKVSDLLGLAEVEEAANAITFKAADGYGIAMPLSYVLEKEAMLVYKVGGQELAEGVQVWVPGTVAKYFTRQVVDVEIEALEEVPAVEGPAAEQRAKISVVSSVEKDVLAVGDQITFEGYADDCGVAIAAVEFSMDNGATWTTCETKDVSADNWVYYHFTIPCEAAGTYKLDARAVSADGTVSPLASSVVFTVE